MNITRPSHLILLDFIALIDVESINNEAEENRPFRRHDNNNGS
jgi:hypothetical protein